jgi:hypothetical protein
MADRRAWIGGFVVLVLADVLFLCPALLSPKVRCPADVTPHWPAFLADRSSAPEPPRNTVIQDWLIQFHPWQHLVRDSWMAGRAPLWNDKAGCGEPLLANSQSEALSPFVPLLLVSGDQYADWRQLAQLLVAQAFTMLAAARLGLSAPAAMVAALAYGFSSFMQIWALHPHSASASFAPGILYGLLLLLERVTILRFAAAAAITACSILAGHVETAAKSALVAGMIAALLSVSGMGRTRRVTMLALIGAVAACGVLLAACQVFPFLAYLGESGAREARGAEVGRGVPAEHLLTLLDPNWFEGPHVPERFDRTVAYADGVVHVGVAGCVLAVLGLAMGVIAKPRLTVCLAVTGGAALAVACAADVPWWPRVPVLGEVWRFRFTFLAFLPLALLSGIGAETLCTAGARRGAGARRAVGAIVVILTGVTAAWPWYRFVPHASLSDLHPPSRALASLRSHSSTGRSLEIGAVAQGVGQMYGVSSLRRFDAVGLHRYGAALCGGDRRPPLPYFFTELTSAQPAILDALSVRWVLAMYPADEARRAAGGWTVTAGPGLRLDRSSIVPAQKVREFVLIRYDGGLRDGSIGVTFHERDGERVMRLGRDGWDGAGRKGERASAPSALSDFSAHLGVAHEVLRLESEDDASVDELTFSLTSGGRNFDVVAVAPGGVGPSNQVVDDFGWLKISERRTAMPYAYLSPGHRVVASEAEAVAALRDPAFDPHEETIIEAPGGDRFLAERGGRATGLEVDRKHPGAIDVRVQTPAPRLLVVTDAYARGWEARIGGERVPLFPANVVGMACAVPPGGHVVSFRYVPGAFIAGVIVSGVTLLALIAAAIWRARRRGSRDAPLTA